MKSKCPTYLKSNGKAMALTLSDGKVSDDETKCEVVKPIEVSLSRKISVDLKESKSKESTLSKDKMHGKLAWVCHFCGKSGHIHPNCYKLQAAKRANKPKVPVPQAQDPIALIGELVKALNLYFNP